MKITNKIKEDWLMPALFALLIIGMCVTKCSCQVFTGNIAYVNNQTELRNAVRIAETLPINTIWCLQEFTIDSVIYLSGNLKTKTRTLEITKGAFTCNDSNGCFKRKPTDQDVAEEWMQNNIRFTDCGFYGRGSGTAVYLAAQFGGGVTNCYFYNFATAIEQHFNLNAFNGWNRYSVCNQSSYQGTAVGQWANGISNKADVTKSCNNTFNLQNRAYNKNGGYAAFMSVDNSSQLDLLNISEGGTTDYDFIYTCKGNNAKNNNNVLSYIEKTTNKANFGINVNDGNVIIDNTWSQKSATFVDASGSGANSQVHITNICYLPGQTKFKANGTLTSFNFCNVRYNWNVTSAWIGSVMPKYYFGEKCGTTHDLIYPGKSLRYNSEPLDSSVIRVNRLVLKQDVFK